MKESNQRPKIKKTRVRAATAARNDEHINAGGPNFEDYQKLQ